MHHTSVTTIDPQPNVTDPTNDKAINDRATSETGTAETRTVASQCGNCDAMNSCGTHPSVVNAAAPAVAAQEPSRASRSKWLSLAAVSAAVTIAVAPFCTAALQRNGGPQHVIEEQKTLSPQFMQSPIESSDCKRTGDETEPFDNSKSNENFEATNSENGTEDVAEEGTVEGVEDSFEHSPAESHEDDTGAVDQYGEQDDGLEEIQMNQEQRLHEDLETEPLASRAMGLETKNYVACREPTEDGERVRIAVFEPNRDIYIHESEHDGIQVRVRRYLFGTSTEQMVSAANAQELKGQSAEAFELYQNHIDKACYLGPAVSIYPAEEATWLQPSGFLTAMPLDESKDKSKKMVDKKKETKPKAAVKKNAPQKSTSKQASDPKQPIKKTASAKEGSQKNKLRKEAAKKVTAKKEPSKKDVTKNKTNLKDTGVKKATTPKKTSGTKEGPTAKSKGTQKGATSGKSMDSKKSITSSKTKTASAKDKALANKAKPTMTKPKSTKTKEVNTRESKAKLNSVASKTTAKKEAKDTKKPKNDSTKKSNEPTSTKVA
jgi:hypothetical protein